MDYYYSSSARVITLLECDDGDCGKTHHIETWKIFQVKFVNGKILYNLESLEDSELVLEDVESSEFRMLPSLDIHYKIEPVLILQHPEWKNQSPDVFFPTWCDDYITNTMMVYNNIGGHSSASEEYVKECKKVSKALALEILVDWLNLGTTEGERSVYYLVQNPTTIDWVEWAEKRQLQLLEYRK